MKELTEKQVEDGVAALDQLRERIVPKHFTTPRATIQALFAESPEATHLKQVLMWDEKHERLTLANTAEPSESHTGNDTNPCPPLCGPG